MIMPTLNIAQASQVFDIISHGLFGVVMLATIIVKLTPTKSDDKKLDKIMKQIHKYMSYFPTLGQNQRTKELEKNSEAQAGGD